MKFQKDQTEYIARSHTDAVEMRGGTWMIIVLVQRTLFSLAALAPHETLETRPQPPETFYYTDA